MDRHPELTEMCLRLIILFIEASDSLNNSGKKITLSTCIIYKNYFLFMKMQSNLMQVLFSSSLWFKHLLYHANAI